MGLLGWASVASTEQPMRDNAEESTDAWEESTEETSSISVGSTSHVWSGVEACPRDGETREQAEARVHQYIVEYERQDKIRMWQENAKRIDERRARRAARRKR